MVYAIAAVAAWYGVGVVIQALGAMLSDQNGFIGWGILRAAWRGPLPLLGVL